MKNYLRFLSPVMLLIMAVMFGGGKIYAKEVTYSVASKTSVTASVKLEGVTTSFNNTYTQSGSDKAQVTGGKNMTLTIKGFKGTVSAVRLNQKATKKGTGDLKISINGNNVVSKSFTKQEIPNSYSECTYNIVSPVSTTGDIVITLSAETNSLYCDSFTLVYEDEDNNKTATTLSFPTSSYTYEVGQDNGTVIIDNNAAVLKDKEGNAISDATGKITYSVESSVTDLAILGSDENSSDIIVNTNNAGTATVTATFAGDDTYAASKASYTINVIKVITSIADLKKQELSNKEQTFTLKLTDAVVSYVHGDNAYMEDASAGILVFLKDAQTLTAGQKFNGLVEVSVKTWYSLPEITSWAPFTSMTTETVTELPLQVVTVEELINNYDKYEGRRVKVLGATITTDFSKGQSGQISQNGSSITLRAGDNTIKATRNDIVNVIGFPSVYEANTRTIQLAIWEQSAIEVIKTETLTTSAKGYATYSADYAVNYSELGLTAYTLTVDETNKTVTAQAFMGVVPAGGAVLVKGDASKAYTLTPATTEGDATFATALLTGATKADGTQYGFTSKSGTPAFAQVVSGQDIPAKKGYIVLSGSSAAKYAISFDGEATGIHTIEVASAANAAMYNLAGQRVDKAYKGIVIVNGKKYLNK